MRTKIGRSFVRCIITATCLLVALGNSGTFILCIGEDGHVAIEAAVSDCCESHRVDVTETPFVAFGRSDPQASSDDCGSCVDIPLSVGLTDILSIAKRASLVFVASAPVGPSPVETPQLSDLVFALESFMPTPYFTPLRSIILLI
ncbi:MAG: hypothetical protein ACYS6W_14905 [Planctomycetota bacterium]|jgi:hypothetical protein